MRNIQNINIRYGSGVPVPCDPLVTLLQLNMEGSQAKQRAKAIDDAAKEWQGLM